MSAATHASQVEDWSRVAWTGSRYIDVLEPAPEDILLEEVATGLSRQNRFGAAATTRAWSVLRHSLVCLAFAEEDGISENDPGGRRTLRTILLHDGPEYILGDLIRPVKSWCPSYRGIEKTWWAAFSKKFSLWPSLCEVEKHYDMLSFASEKAHFVSGDCGDWPGLPDPRPIPREVMHGSDRFVLESFLQKAYHLLR